MHIRALIKKILPNYVIKLLKKVIGKYNNPNDQRRFWNNEDLFLKDNYFDSFLNKKTKCKRITFKNQTKPFFLLNKNKKYPLMNLKIMRR